MPPAARLTDVTDHVPCLNTGPCSPDVYIGDQKAWRALPADDWSGLEEAAEAMKTLNRMESMDPETARPYLNDAEEGLKDAAEKAAAHGEAPAATITASAFSTLASKDATLTAMYRAEEPIDKMMAMKNYADGIHEASQIASALSVEAIGKLSDQTNCPQVWIIVPHGPGVITTGAPTVLFNDLPAAREEDVLYEAIGGPDPVARGFPTVIIGDEGTSTERPQRERASLESLATAQTPLPEDLREPVPVPLPDPALLGETANRPLDTDGSSTTGLWAGIWKELKGQAAGAWRGFKDELPVVLLIVGLILLVKLIVAIPAVAALIAAIVAAPAFATVAAIFTAIMIALLVVYVASLVYAYVTAPNAGSRGEVIGRAVAYLPLYLYRPLARGASRLRHSRFVTNIVGRSQGALGRLRNARWVRRFLGRPKPQLAPKGLPPGKPGSVTRNMLEQHEFDFAGKIADFRGGKLVGAPRRGLPGIDGALDGVPISLKQTKGGLSAVLKHASKAEAQALKAGKRGVELFIEAPNVGKASLLDFAGKGPLVQIPNQGRISYINILTKDGWVRIIGGGL